MPHSLPPNATPASHRLYDLALRLADACPPEFASEIALVGSAAMGLSDDQSDLDINFWNETIPPEAERVAWLESLGATDIKVGQMRQEDRSYPCSGMINGVEVGCSWQSFTSLNFFLELILTAGENEYHMVSSRLETFTDVLVQALPLRTSDVIDSVQRQLGIYPEIVFQREIRNLTNVGHIEAAIKSIRRALRYADEIELEAWIADEIGGVINALYPLNRRWYPQAKWRYQLARDLPIQPPNLYARIGLALHDPDLRQRPVHLARLLLDTLALVPTEYDVSAATAALEAFLKEQDKEN